MTTQTNRAAQGTQRALEFELMVQQAGRYDPRAADDAEQAEYLADWHRKHPHARRITGRDVLGVVVILGVALAWWGWPALVRFIYPWQ